MHHIKVTWWQTKCPLKSIQQQPNKICLHRIPLVLILQPRICLNSILLKSCFYIPPTHFIHTRFTKDCSLLLCPLSPSIWVIFGWFRDGIRSPICCCCSMMMVVKKQTCCSKIYLGSLYPFSSICWRDHKAPRQYLLLKSTNGVVWFTYSQMVWVYTKWASHYSSFFPRIYHGKRMTW